jgi:DNA polymerase III delta prime subunit
MKNTLFWRKYRPTTLEDLIILPRIQNSIKNGISNNFLFYGSFGCGKSSLAEILSVEYPTCRINASLHTSIDVIRNKVSTFINKMSILDLDKNLDYKIVYLDEFERLSPEALDSLKGFIEEFDKDVRFIATTNHISKVPNGMLSRFTKIQFDPLNQEEINYLKDAYFKYLQNVNTKENVKLTDDNLKLVINSNFPDLRQMCNVLQDISVTGEFNPIVNTHRSELMNMVIDCILNKEDNIKTYDVAMEFEHDIYQLFNILGRPFIKGLFKYKDGLYKDRIDDITILVTRYSYMFTDKLDPVVHAFALISELKKLF